MPSPPSRSRKLGSVRDSEVFRRAEEDELARARKRVAAKPRAGDLDGGSGGIGRGGKSKAAGGAGAPADNATAAATFLTGAGVATFLFFENPYLGAFETYRLVNAALLLWLPYCVVTLFLKQDLQTFGLTRGDRTLGLRYAGIAILVMLPILVIASLRPDIRAYYVQMLGQPLGALAPYAARPQWTPAVRWLGLAYYECGQGFYLFCWEFFYRGFLLFGLARARWIGSAGAVVIQAAVFALLHWSVVASASKSPEEIASALVGGLVLGWLALRTRTFFYGFVIHWAVSAILDLLLVGSLLVHPR